MSFLHWYQNKFIIIIIQLITCKKKIKRRGKRAQAITAANRPKPQRKRKALSAMHYVYTAAVGHEVGGNVCAE
jgi:hypothetical protein